MQIYTLPIDPLLTSCHRATHYGSPVDTSQVPATSSSTIYYKVKTLERYRCRTGKLILKYQNQEISALRIMEFENIDILVL